MKIAADWHKHLYVLEYPRSGGNWVLKMCSAYLKMPYRDIDKIPETPKQKIALEYFNIPMLARFNKQPVRNPFKFIIKTHHYPEHEPLKTIYCLRDGRDALCSYYYFQKDFIGNALGKKINFTFYNNVPDPVQFEAYIQYRFEEDRMKSLNWVDHVNKALKLKNVHIVRYEDLRKNPFEAMCKILEYLGIKKINMKRLQRIIETESFEKEKERIKINRGEYHVHLRKGKIGTWQDIFTQNSLSFFYSYASELMRELNYNLDGGEEKK